MTDTTILAPRGKRDEAPIPIDMGYWANLEARIEEIATVTPTKAPELLATFNRAALDLDALAITLELEHQVAVREAEKLRAEIILDRVKGILEKKGLSNPKNPLGSEDIREAILSSQPDYDEALERAEQLKAMTKMIRGKYDAFERAFRSVRTLVGEQSFNFTLPQRELSHGGGPEREVGINKPTAQGFGKPRY